MQKNKKYQLFLATTAILVLPITAYSHTNSIGYENAGSGSVTFWYGSWHPGTNFTEGSLNVTGPNDYDVTQEFTLVVQTKPEGLIDGETNFYSDGTQLVATPDPNGTFAWQGATLTELSEGTYTFTYIPIAVPTATWQPTDAIILSSSVFLDAAIVNGTTFQPISRGGSYHAAGVLDAITDTATGAMANAIEALQNLDAAPRATALQKLAPITSQAVSTSSVQTVTGALDSVQVRLDTIRSGGFESVAFNKLKRGESIKTASLDLSNIFNSERKSYSFWTKAFGAYTKQEFADNNAGYHARTGGASFGADNLFDNGLVLGTAFTYAYTDVNMDDFRDGDDSNINSYQITGYGNYDFGKWYLEGMAAIAYQTFDTKRNTGVTGFANGDFDGIQYGTRLTAGKPFYIDKYDFTFTPSIGAEWNYFTQSDYTETGGGALSMHFDDIFTYRLRSVLQFEAEMERQYKDLKITPSLHVGWRHEFHNDGITSTTTFTGGGSQFRTPGQETQEDTLNIGGKANFSKSENFSIGVQLDSETASEYQSYSTQLVGQWKF